MPVNFRQMCGLQTELRPKPDNPLKRFHPVLYYDGNVYDGWQQTLEPKGEKVEMNPTTVEKVLKLVKRGDLTIEEAAELLEKKEIRTTVEHAVVNSSRGGCGGGGGCLY